MRSKQSPQVRVSRQARVGFTPAMPTMHEPEQSHMHYVSANTHPAMSNLYAYLPNNILSLQQTVGNQAVQRLRRFQSSSGVVQRSKQTTDLRAFATRYLAVVDVLRTAKHVEPAQTHELNSLYQLGKTHEYNNSLPSLFAQLQKLCDFANGQSTEALSSILSAFDPNQRTGPNAFQAMAGAAFSPTMENRPERPNFDPTGFDKKYASSLVSEAQQEMETETTLVDARINMVIAKIADVYEHHCSTHPTSPSDRTLLVFLGPEWFFNQGNTPVSREQREHIITTFRAISLLYPEMLIVPGTVLSGDKLKAGLLRPSQGYYKDVTNTAPVLWNGTVLHTINKAGIAGDFSDEKGNWAPGDEKPVFDLGDLRFAIDICVDHASKRAQKYVQQHSEERLPDAHLVTSAGQLFAHENSALSDGGLGLSTDATGIGARFGQTTVNTSGERGGEYMQPGKVLGTDTHTGYEAMDSSKVWLSYYPAMPIGGPRNPLVTEKTTPQGMPSQGTLVEPENTGLAQPQQLSVVEAINGELIEQHQLTL